MVHQKLALVAMAAAAPGPFWTCDVCTFCENPIAAAACEMCNGPPPAPPPPAAADTAASEPAGGIA